MSPQREKGKERQEVEIDAPTIIPFDRAEQDKARLRALEEERRQEYNQVKAKVSSLPEACTALSLLSLASKLSAESVKL